MTLGLDAKAHWEVAFALHMIEPWLREHAVVICGVAALKAGESTADPLPIVGLLATSTGMRGTVRARAPSGLVS